MPTQQAPRSTHGKSVGPKPPPNYFSRSVQVRLMLMVGTLMLVLVLMFEARKPENWLWMGFEDQPEDGEVDTRMAPDGKDGARGKSRPDDEPAAARIPSAGNQGSGSRIDDAGAEESGQDSDTDVSVDSDEQETPEWQLAGDADARRLLDLARLDFWRGFLRADGTRSPRFPVRRVARRSAATADGRA